MKIDDALSTNLAYWQNQAKETQIQIDRQAADVERLQGVLAEANQQIALYTKASALLTSLTASGDTTADQIQVPVTDQK